jgi:hypothetical protein
MTDEHEGTRLASFVDLGDGVLVDLDSDVLDDLDLLGLLLLSDALGIAFFLIALCIGVDFAGILLLALFIAGG